MQFDDSVVIRLVEAIRAQYTLGWNGIHGVSHWSRVWENGMRLAEEAGAEAEVVGLFALFHDARRFNDGRDRGHGKRGAELAAQWRGELFELDDESFDLLCTACEQHTDGQTEGDVTVQACWDADRLDLGRVGIIPQPHRLCTEFAQREETIAWANERAYREITNPLIMESWVTHA
ncbi:MAG: hypothetical protein ACKVJG_28510 [Candidatus Latescibacterota bacterium]|jgi:uncharacterized protein